jgi:hypothetical protein
VTSYKYGEKDFVKTPKGVQVSAPATIRTPAFLKEVDQLVDEVEKCLQERDYIKKPLNRKWFGVVVPINVFKSPCSGQYLVPSRVNYRLCEAKGVTIKPECRYVEEPTKECPCPCSMRSVIQDDWAIITTQTLNLFKAELVRLVTSKNNPWLDPRLVPCLR